MERLYSVRKKYSSVSKLNYLNEYKYTHETKNGTDAFLEGMLNKVNQLLKRTLVIIEA